MFFKNLIAYRFSREMNLDLEKLEGQLKEFLFTPCGEKDKQKFGWVEPTGRMGGESFVHAANGHILLTAQKQIKLMPSDTINSEVNARVKVLELQEGRPLKKKEKDNVKEDVVLEMLPRAFTRDTFVNLLILPAMNMILVDVSSHTKAEEVLALLRKTIGSLPVIPAMPNKAFETLATEWVKTGDVPAGFTLEDKVVLKSVLAEGGTANLNHQELDSDEVKAHLAADKVVTKCAFNWQDRVSYMMADSMIISNMKWSDELQDQNADIPKFEELARFDADFALMCGELTAFIPQVFDCFGGLTTIENGNQDKKADFGDMCRHVELLEEARDLVVKNRRASVAGLQRHFKIGYNQAYRIMEALEKCWIVSEPKSDGAREILVSDQTDK